MELQVISAKRLPQIRASRDLIVFYFRRNVEAVTAGTEERKTDTGTMKISATALTTLDLLRYPQASGGIDNVATVLFDLRQKIDPEQLATSDWASMSSYAQSQHTRPRIEPAFGWLNTVARIRKVKLRGLAKVDWLFVFARAAFNLIPLPKLLPRPG